MPSNSRYAQTARRVKVLDIVEFLAARFGQGAASYPEAHALAAGFVDGLDDRGWAALGEVTGHRAPSAETRAAVVAELTRRSRPAAGDPFAGLPQAVSR